MKRYFVLILLLWAQVVVAQDIILLKDFKINGHISRNDTKAQVLIKLGTPTKESIEFNEMDDIEMTVLYYGDSKLYLQNDLLGSFEINDSALFISYSGNQIKVGQPISSVAQLFPSSYAKRNEGYHRTAVHSVELWLLGALTGGTQEVELDDSISIRYDSNTEKIIGIWLGSS